MKAQAISAFLLAIAASAAFATAQFPDKIFYEGKEYSLHTNPMDAYFEKHPKKKPENDLMSTALWRGYVASFEFKKDSLVLKDLEIEVMKESGNENDFDTEWVSKRDVLVPRGKELEIDWFTGLLVLPHGKLVNYVHMGYRSTFSDYILLEIKMGKLTGKRSFDHKQYEKFKQKQFEAYKKTDDYKKLVERLEKEGDTKRSIDSHIRSFVVNYTSEFLIDEGPKKKAQERKTIRPGRKR